MKTGIAALALVLALWCQPAQAQGDLFANLQAEAVQALIDGDVDRAQTLAERIEKLTDQNSGEQAALSHYTLAAELLFRVGDIEGATRVYAKAVETARNTGLWSTPSALAVRYDYGNLLLLTGDNAHGLEIALDLLADIEHLDQLTSPVGMDAVVLVGLAHQALGDFNAAWQRFATAAGIARQHDSEGQTLRTALVGQAAALTQLGAFEAALDPSREVVELDQKRGDTASEPALFARLQYGMALQRAGQLANARAVSQSVLDVAEESLPAGHVIVQFANQTLENIDRAEGRRHAANIRNQALQGSADLPANPAERLNRLLNLAAHNLQNAEMEGYEAALVSALELIVAHPDIAPRLQQAQIMFALADVLAGQRLMFLQARPLYDQSIRILTEEFGPTHRETLQVKVRRIQAKDQEVQANVSLRRPASELAFWDGTEEGRKPTPQDLEVLRLLAAEESRSGTSFAAHASQMMYAFYLTEAGQFDLALDILDAQVDARRAERKQAAASDPEVDFRLADARGTTLLKAGRAEAAAEAFHRGTQPLLFHLRGSHWRDGSSATADVYLQGQTYGELFASSALRASQAVPARRESYVDLAFQAMQLAGYGPVSSAVARAATQEAVQDPGFVRLAAEWQEAALSTDADRSAPDRIRARLAAEFAEFHEWQVPDPLELSEVQKTVLSKDEALIAILTATTQSVSADGVKGLVLAVTQERAVLQELPLDWLQVVQDINSLHEALDPKPELQQAALRAPLTSVQGASGPDRLAAPFAFDAASRLHDAFFGAPEIAELLATKQTWTVVPYGETLGIPFAALIVEDPRPASRDGRRTAAELRDIRWLGHERALQVVPSVHALKTLRDRTSRNASEGRLAYIGIGAPAFSGEAHAALPGADTVMRRAGPDRSKAVQGLPPLPGTRREIETLADMFGAGLSEIRLGPEASEAQVTQLDDAGTLARAGIVHFATHGLLSGAFEGLLEPALALTPGSTALVGDGYGDDGLLTASEAARLTLNADWVILSACDTAGDDSFGGEGLGGLVQGFFAAGARNVLASHWRVEDRAAERLITRTVGLSRDGLPKAEALRRAMQDMAADQARDQTHLPNAHPSVWAPFLMIGGG